MNSRVTIVFSATMAYVHGMPGKINAPAADAPTYFQNKLNQIQEALDDTVRAGMDLETMETKLRNIVNFSSYFFRTESATEYATDKDAYANAWTKPAKKSVADADPSCTKNDDCLSGICYQVPGVSGECTMGEKSNGDSCEVGLEQCGNSQNRKCENGKCT